MFEQVVSILSDFTEVSPGNISPESNLTEDLKLDSVSYFAIIFQFEEKFGLEIADEDAMKMHTVGDIVNYLEENA